MTPGGGTAEERLGEISAPRSKRRHFVVGRFQVIFAGFCDSCA